MYLPVFEEKEDEEARDQRNIYPRCGFLLGGPNRQRVVLMLLSAGVADVTS